MSWWQDLRCTLFHRWGTGYKLMFRARLPRVQLDGYLCDRCPQWWEEVALVPHHGVETVDVVSGEGQWTGGERDASRLTQAGSSGPGAM